jgi:uncharacterized membrane protein YkvA (DUF1232 family)
MSTQDYSSNFSSKGLWLSLSKHLKRLGRKAVLLALQLYYAADDATTPIWAKSLIYFALGYLILPIDAIPDMLPIIGLSDDIAVMSAALVTVAAHVGERHRQQAEQRLQGWFE